ncbi:Hypothetical protein NTJ_12645 [Nesidiocoris tenuis]|uniref:HOOK N-terminal domain-containing protein n=1 Tax=Nesidiocoris tenuis TaxID=355587 RepID=A0ABN7B611_9HEMI|nr:Hypothetical protein NTJ_12645 [Nesidiocoris tenuis]
MKIADWENVVLVWVNALQLSDEEITDVSQLHTSDFFKNLIGRLSISVQPSYRENGEALDYVKTVLKEEFKGFVPANGDWDSQETTLVTSLLLLLSAFKCQSLRTPLYQLSGQTQLVIQAFIQKFISLHKISPLDQITREQLIASLTDLCSDEDDSQMLDDIIEIDGTPPPKRALSPMASFVDSPDSLRNGRAKMKSLECQIDLLSWDNQHLTDEIEILKSDLGEMRNKFENKSAQVLKLENELFLVKNTSFRDASSLQIDGSNLTEEVNLLRSDLETLTTRLANCVEELDQEQLANVQLSAKLKKAEEENVLLMQRCSENDVKIQALQANTADLEGVVASLKTTVREQAELLSDSSFIASSPLPRDMSLNESAIIGETMASVVEIKFSELEDEVKKVKQALCYSEQKITDMEAQLQSKERELEKYRQGNGSVDKLTAGIARLEFELAEKCLEIEALKNDKKSLSASVAEKQSKVDVLFEHQKTQTAFPDEAPRAKNHSECKCSEYRQKTIEESDDLVEKMTQLCQLFDGEKVDLNKEEFVKIRNRLAQEKRSLLSENGDLKSKLASAQSKMSELVGELVTLIGEDSADSPPAVIVSKLSSKMKSLTLEIEKLSAINEGNVDEICNCRKEIAQHLATIGEAHEELALLRERLRKTEVELETLRGQHRVRGTEFLALQQAVSMCEHEKAILQRRNDLLNAEANKAESLKNEVSRLKAFVNNLECELSTEKLEHKRSRDQLETNQKMSRAFDTKFASLQIELKSQYDKELARTVDEFNDKIDQMKRRMVRDRNQIKDLSSELWETSDRYLLASQEAEALRNQLRRTKAALEIVANRTPQKSNAIPQGSHPCLWTRASESNDEFDEKITVLRERRAKRLSGNSLWYEGLNRFSEEQPEDESFGDVFLDDLKAGIVRLPNHCPTLVSARASCPPPIKVTDSSGGSGDRCSNDKQSLIPPDKPKRKEQVAYCRPGPPTPSKNARLSLQSLDKVSHLREPPLLRERPQPNRLSRFFNLSTKTNKTGSAGEAISSGPSKRKSFFKKFATANRENVPPPWI